MLELAQVSKRFDGLLAVAECSFRVKPGQVFGVIGPNGSGKSTLFNVICGLLRPESGSVAFDGRPITGVNPHRLAKLGIGRTFQVPRIFEGMTLEQNMRVPATLFADRQRRPIEAYLEDFGLLELRRVLAKDISHGQQKLLEFAMVSAMEPKLFLFDEPTAGVNPQFIARMEAIIRTINKRGATVLMVEHTLRVVDALCDEVLVLDQGRVIAQGSPARLKSIPEVRKAYYLL